VNRDAGATGRASGVTVGLLTMAALAGGAGVMTIIPRFVLGGLLLMLGARLLWDWGIASHRKLSLHEWLLTVIVIGTTAIFGFLPALLTGVVGGCVLLALSVGRLAILRRHYGIDEEPSSLQRPEEELLILAGSGSEARVLELGGFIFFGSAYQLYDFVKAILITGSVHALVLDFSGVIGIDSSATAILGRIQILARRADVPLFMSGLGIEGTRRLGAVIDPSVRHFPVVDEALEAVEDLVLAKHGPRSAVDDSAGHWLMGALGDADLARELIPILSFENYRPGAILCRQGDATDSLLFIQSGRVSVVVETAGQPATRVRVFCQHTIAGELGFLLGTPRSATLRVEQDAAVGLLSRADFDSLGTQRPALALALLNYLVRIQAERLSFTTRRLVGLRR
jgi:sulfate permease, SulP family